MERFKMVPPKECPDRKACEQQDKCLSFIGCPKVPGGNMPMVAATFAKERATEDKAPKNEGYAGSFISDAPLAPAPDPTNPKDGFAAAKVPLHLWPAVASALGAVALLDGAYKYGRSNFRATPVRYTIYHDACLRHMARILEGEWIDSKSNVPHIGHALACLAIIADAQAMGTLVDDRNFSNAEIGESLTLADAMVPAIRAAHVDTPLPKHYDINDAEF
jgi:hypothetical protein